MAKIDELIISFATVLARYHDVQESKKLVEGNNSAQNSGTKSRAYVTNLYKSNPADFYKAIEPWIGKLITNHPRRSLLFKFIAHEIQFLSALQKQTEVMDATNLDKLKFEINQLIIDCRKLITTSKDKSCELRLSQLPPCYKSNLDASHIASVISGSKDCDSGNFLKEELFTYLRINQDSTHEELQNLASLWSVECNEAKELSHLRKINLEYQTLIQTHHTTAAKVIELENTVKQQAELISVLQLEGKTLGEEKSTLTKKIASLENENTLLKQRFPEKSHPKDIKGKPTDKKGLPEIAPIFSNKPQTSLKLPSTISAAGFYNRDKRVDYDKPESGESSSNNSSDLDDVFSL